MLHKAARGLLNLRAITVLINPRSDIINSKNKQISKEHKCKDVIKVKTKSLGKQEVKGNSREFVYK